MLVWLLAVGIFAVANTGAIYAWLHRQPVAAPRPSTTAAPTDPGGDFAFLNVVYVDGERVPVRWNPCEPIEYQVNIAVDGASEAMSSIQQAATQASDATGIAFQFDGLTDETVRDMVRQAYFSDALHAVYRPVLITIVSHEAFERFHVSRRAVAFARPVRGNQARGHQYVSGIVVVDADYRYAAQGRSSMPLVIQHELGHLLGLAHVEATGELMFSPEVAPKGTVPYQLYGWGPGDEQGLARLGATQGCLTHLEVAG